VNDVERLDAKMRAIEDALSRMLRMDMRHRLAVSVGVQALTQQPHYYGSSHKHKHR
jgi:hypothetical protein